MAERGGMWLERVVEAAGATMGAAAMWLSVHPGQGQQQPKLPPVDEDDDDYNPLNEPEEDVLPPVVQAAFDRLGLRGGRLHERTEGMVATYKLLKSLGVSDADIARLVVQRAGDQVDEGLEHVRPAEARLLFEAIEDVVVRAAEEVDTRLNMRGDLVRRIRDSAVATRSGREEALAGMERGLAQGREQLRRLLKSIAREDAE